MYQRDYVDTPRGRVLMYECVGCGYGFDPVKYRWLCPKCHTKNSCCEGVPLPEESAFSYGEVPDA
jgi:rubredoxin